MTDIITVWRKELLELFGDRHSRRGALIQAGIMVACVGVLVPSQSASAWLAGQLSVVLPFLMFAPVLAAVLAADAFAGERERRTLETLFATPLQPSAILTGKVAAAVSFSFAATLVAFISAIVVTNVVGHPAHFYLPGLAITAATLGGGLAAATLVTGIAIVISARVPVARSVQQMTSMLSMAFVGGVLYLWDRLGLPFDPRTILIGELLVLGLAVIGLRILLRLFQPDRVLV